MNCENFHPSECILNFVLYRVVLQNDQIKIKTGAKRLITDCQIFIIVINRNMISVNLEKTVCKLGD